jgi:hypothetical protein
VAAGKSDRQIGAIVGVSHRTVQKHLEHAYVKLGVENRTVAAMRAMRSDVAPSRDSPEPNGQKKDPAAAGSGRCVDLAERSAGPVNPYYRYPSLELVV